MSDTRRELIEDVMDAMGNVRGAFRHGHGPMRAKHGVGMSHFRSMLRMADSEGGISVNEMAEAMSVTPGAVTQFVDKLVDKGMVERFEDSKDRRVVRVKLTDKAKQRFSKMREFHFERMTKLFQNLEDEELAKLAELVRKIEIDPEDCKGHHHGHRWHRHKRQTEDDQSEE